MGTQRLKRFAAIVSMLLISVSVRAETMLVVDGSNSMWGEIDKVAKIEIAQNAINGLLDEWSAAEPLGVAAYGHRSTWGCDDSQVLLEPGATSNRLRRAVSSIQPKGRTPLTSALVAASRTLINRRAANPTLILLTDGFETCGRDLCLFAYVLAATHPDFRIHVISFGMSDSMRRVLDCLTDETGGLALAADTADALSQAMTTVAQRVGEQAHEQALSAEPVRSKPKLVRLHASLQELLSPPHRVETPPMPAQPATAVLPTDGVQRDDPSRILHRRALEVVSQSLTVQLDESESIQNATGLSSRGPSGVEFHVRLARAAEPPLGVNKPLWTLYERQGQQRGQKLQQIQVQQPAYELLPGDYFMEMTAENIRYNYGFTVGDTLPSEHIITLNLGRLDIDVENNAALDISAFRFARGPEKPSLDFAVRGPWSHSLLLPAGTYVVQGRMANRQKTVGPLVIEPGKTTHTRILVQ